MRFIINGLLARFEETMGWRVRGFYVWFKNRERKNNNNNTTSVLL